MRPRRFPCLAWKFFPPSQTLCRAVAPWWRFACLCLQPRRRSKTNDSPHWIACGRGDHHDSDRRSSTLCCTRDEPRYLPECGASRPHPGPCAVAMTPPAGWDKRLLAVHGSGGMGGWYMQLGLVTDVATIGHTASVIVRLRTLPCAVQSIAQSIAQLQCGAFSRLTLGRFDVLVYLIGQTREQPAKVLDESVASLQGVVEIDVREPVGCAKQRFDLVFID